MAITRIPVGVRSTACQVWKQLEPRTSNEDNGDECKQNMNTMIVHMHKWKTVIARLLHMVAFFRMAFVDVRASQMQSPRAHVLPIR